MGFLSHPALESGISVLFPVPWELNNYVQTISQKSYPVASSGSVPGFGSPGLSLVFWGASLPVKDNSASPVSTS